jgi:hypothetical protein
MIKEAFPQVRQNVKSGRAQRVVSISGIRTYDRVSQDQTLTHGISIATIPAGKAAQSGL